MPRRGARRVIGAMTGTSIDAVDAAAVRIEGRGLRARVTLLGSASASLDAVRDALRAMQRQEPLPAGAVAAAARELALAHLPALRALAASHGTPDLVVLHGQTLFHAPPASLQLIAPAPIAAELGCDVLYDLRARDLALGGQGAPITPLADWVLFRSARHPRAIVNLGGFANATLLPAAPTLRGSVRDRAWVDAVRGFDICLCNQLLDHLARTRLGEPFDRDGAHASRGTVQREAQAAVERLLDAQAAAGRSLGTADEIVFAAGQALAALATDDALATAAAAVGSVIGTRIAAGARQLLAPGARTPRAFLAGGGARHAPLARAIGRALGAPAATTDALGVPPDAREAVAMAVLGALAVDGVPVTLPAVTGRREGPGLDGVLCRGAGGTFTESSHAATAAARGQHG